MVKDELDHFKVKIAETNNSFFYVKKVEFCVDPNPEHLLYSGSGSDLAKKFRIRNTGYQFVLPSSVITSYNNFLCFCEYLQAAVLENC